MRGIGIGVEPAALVLGDILNSNYQTTTDV
jgi:hypothetical protein